MKGLIKEFSPVTPLRDLSFLGEQTKRPLPLFALFFSFPPYILTSLKYLLNAHLFLMVVFHLLSRVRLFGTPWTAACQASLSSTVSQSLLKFLSIDLVILSISSSASLFFLCLQSFPASGSFPMTWLITSGGTSVGASASASVLRVIFRVDFLGLGLPWWLRSII